MKDQELHILLIEDDDADALEVAALLHGPRFIVSRMNYMDLAVVRLDLRPSDGVDVIIVGIDLQDDSDLDQLQLLCAKRTDIPVLVVGELDEDMVMRVIAVGAHDYVGHLGLSRLPRAIRIAIKRRARRSNGVVRDYQSESDVDQTGEWNTAVSQFQNCTTRLEKLTQSISVEE